MQKAYANGTKLLRVHFEELMKMHKKVARIMF